MKADVFPTARTVDLEPLTNWISEFLPPIVNKPVVEHLLERLARHGIRDILPILKHMPDETEGYFAGSFRWDVRLSCFLPGAYRGLGDTLERLYPARLEGPFVGMPGGFYHAVSRSLWGNLKIPGQSPAGDGFQAILADCRLRPGKRGHRPGGCKSQRLSGNCRPSVV